ncbi:MAG: TonB-dependent receptor, partial [Runella slithyformis]
GAANFSGAIEPLYLLDGTPVSRDAILGIPVTDLESIDVLKGPSASLFGSQGAGGVLAFFTKRGSPNYDVTTEKAPGTLVTKMMGYQTEREFYAPKYDTKPTFDRPDFRSTLLWLPRIQTNANGQATVTFYHSDATNKAQINVQGLAPNGQVGAAVGSYDLK